MPVEVVMEVPGMDVSIVDIVVLIEEGKEPTAVIVGDGTAAIVVSGLSLTNSQENESYRRTKFFGLKSAILKVFDTGFY